MKISFLIFLILPFYVFSNDLVNWKEYKKNINKPVFILLTDDFNNQTDKKIFSNKRLAKLLNEKFYSIKINVNKETDFKNRYLLMTPPSIAILDQNGIIITKKRNYSALTIERDLYNYLESENNKSMKRMLSDVSRQAMYEVYYSAYFLENSKELVDRSDELRSFLVNKINLKKMYFNVSYLRPLYDYCFSILNMKNSTGYENLIVDAHINSLLENKIFDKDHIFKASYNDWSRPIDKIIYKDNINLLILLYKSGNTSMALKVDHFLNDNYKKMTTEEKILYKTFVSNNLTKDVPKDLKTLINNNKNSKYLRVQTAILKAYFSFYKHDKNIKSEMLNFIDKLENNFYDEKKGIFYDVKKGTEPFGFKYVNIHNNIELAYLYTELYQIDFDFNNLMMAKYILSFMNTTSIDNLIYSKYLLAIENLSSLENKILKKIK